MIETLVLPNRPVLCQRLIDEMRRSTLESIQDYWQRPNPLAGRVYQRCEDQVNVVRHDHGRVEVETGAVVVQAAP